jgi:hypothetical protein
VSAPQGDGGRRISGAKIGSRRLQLSSIARWNAIDRTKSS